MSVLDASALLALLNAEEGAALVAEHVTSGRAVMSSVNYAEVASKLSDHGLPEEAIREALESLSLRVIAFSESHALTCGLLRRSTREAGLSLGDRACLALALQEDLPAVTADRRWQGVTDIPLEVVR